jgi:hypothetical protein
MFGLFLCFVLSSMLGVLAIEIYQGAFKRDPTLAFLVSLFSGIIAALSYYGAVRNNQNAIVILASALFTLLSLFPGRVCFSYMCNESEKRRRADHLAAAFLFALWLILLLVAAHMTYSPPGR